jgi:hypothetical protein
MDKNKSKGQMRYTDAELSLIKASFADNDELLKTIRRVFLQMDLTMSDVELLGNLTQKKELLSVIRKAFLPVLDGNAPFHQVVDLWMTLGISDKTPDSAYPHILAREKLISYLDQQLKVLEGERAEKIKFSKLCKIEKKDPVEIFSDLIVRNTILGHTEMQLAQFSLLAGMKDETVEDTKKRLMKDSNQ